MVAAACSAEVLALVEHLRLAGLSLGVDDHVRAQRVYAAVSALPDGEGRASRDRLRDALRAVLVRSQAYGDAFAAAFEVVFAPRGLSAGAEAKGDGAEAPAEVVAAAPVPKVPSHAVTVAVPVSVALAVAAAVMFAIVSAARVRNEVALGSLRPQHPGCRAVPVPGYNTERVFDRREERPFRQSAAVLAAVGVALAVWGAWGARRGVRKYRDRFLPGPWSYRVPVATSERAPVFSRSEVHRAAALLARAGDDDGTHVSWPRTIESTARRGGFPTIVRARSARAPVVGFVVDRSPGTARWRSSVEELLERLKRSGAAVRVWWSDGDPRFVRATTASGVAQSLVSLRFEVDALVLIGEAREARDAWWPPLSRFERRLWLHPLPASRWDDDARSLGRVVPMEHASVDALARLHDAPRGRGASPRAWSSAAERHPGSVSSVGALRAYLGLAFPWLCAAAVARAPDLALAQVLGRRVGAKGVAWSDWLRLATLPLFDETAWRPGIREALLAELTEAQRRTAQAWLVAKLTDAEGAPPEGTVAAMSRELHRIDLERALGHDVDAKRLGVLLASPMRLAADGLVPSASRGASMRYAGALSWRRVLPEVALAGVGVGALAASGEAARVTVRVETVREARVPKPPRIVCDELRCPEGTVLVPAGEFLMGSAESDTLAVDNEKPQHRVRMSAFCIDRTEVTVAQYRAWSGSATDTPGTEYASCNWGHADRDNHPINCVGWSQADAFCSAHGGSLPTEAQWEYAARGSDRRVYPWGNGEPRDQLCWSGGGTARNGTCAVGSIAGDRSPFGLDDMAGNVYEWIVDYNRPYGATTDPPISNPVEPLPEFARGVRGGGWHFTRPKFVRAAYRYGFSGGFHSDYLGFRCVRGSR